jgi:hypothetical protein
MIGPDKILRISVKTRAEAAKAQVGVLPANAYVTGYTM